MDSLNVKKRQPMFEFIQTTDLKNLLFVFIPVRMVQVVFVAGV